MPPSHLPPPCSVIMLRRAPLPMMLDRTSPMAAAAGDDGGQRRCRYRQRSLPGGLPQTPSLRWCVVDHQKEPRAGRRSFAPPAARRCSPLPARLKWPESRNAGRGRAQHTQGAWPRAKERRRCRRSVGSRRYWLANACGTLCCLRCGCAGGRGSGLSGWCGSRAGGAEAFEAGSGTERLRRRGDLMGVQGARELMRRRAGEPQRLRPERP